MSTRSVLAVTAVVLSLGLSLALSSEPAPEPAQAEIFAVDPVHTSVVFRIKHLGVSYFYGRFNETSGSVRFDSQDPARSAIAFQIKTESVDTNNGQRDGHLKSPDFFNAKEFPLISFESTQIKKAAGKTYDVTGDLTLHGVTRPITLKLEHVGTGQASPRFGYRIGFEATATIKRSDFGIDHMLGEMLSDEVRVTVSIEAKRV